MNLKEHLQFFLLMIPTLLLIIAAVVSLAVPTGSAGAARSEAMGPDAQSRQELAGVDPEAHAVVLR